MRRSRPACLLGRDRLVSTPDSTSPLGGTVTLLLLVACPRHTLHFPPRDYVTEGDSPYLAATNVGWVAPSNHRPSRATRTATHASGKFLTPAERHFNFLSYRVYTYNFGSVEDLITRKSGYDHSMPKNRVYKCTACARSHERPTGKHCRWQHIEQQEEQAQPEARAEPDIDVVATLNSLKEQIDSLGRQMGDRQSNTSGAASLRADPIQQHHVIDQAASPAVGQREIPSIRDLRRDYCVEREVNRRLAELDVDDEVLEPPRQGSRRSRGKRSGAARTVQDKVVRDIDWPHFHIYTPPGAEPMTYERLSVQEFTYGYMLMVDQPDASFDRQVMWELLKILMEDATEYPWENVLNFFGVVGSHVENDRMEWSDTEGIAKLRVKQSQKHDVVAVIPTAAAPKQEKIRYCGPYQKGSCPERGDHAGLRHICAYCFRVKSAPYPHPEAECRRKSMGEQPKNLNGGE